MPDDDEGHGTAGGVKQRAFVQALFSRQSLTFADAKPLIAAIETAHTPERPTLAEDVTPEEFEGYVQTANDALAPFDFEVRSARHQLSKERVYALVNTTSDALTQMATVHSPDEIAFVKRVLDAMFDTNNTRAAEVMAVTSMEAVKLNRPRGGGGHGDRRESESNSGTQAASSALTLAQAEHVLKDLVHEGWFELSARGFYSLSPRALMELTGWLVSTYNEPADSDMDDDDDEDDDGPRHEKIKFCAACRDIVTVGQRCPNPPCDCRMHEFCVRNKFRAQGGREECPTCETPWQDAPPVGEKAARSRANRPVNGRRTTNGYDDSLAG